MARQVKPFSEHSPRWQREQRQKGVDPRKWDRWRQLSAKSRKATKPDDYAAGESVREQVRKTLLDNAAAVVHSVHTTVRGASRENGEVIKLAAVRRNLAHPDAGMSNARLRGLANASPQQLAREIDESLSRRYNTGERSPFWYEKRG